MKVRPILWYRKEEEMLSPRGYILESTMMIGISVSYSCLAGQRRARTREEFEKQYLEWKAQNEG